MTMAGGLSAALNANDAIASLFLIIALTGTQFGIGSFTAIGAQPSGFGVTGMVTAAGTEVVTLAQAPDESTTATISGSITPGDIASIVVQNASLTGGQKTIQYSIVGGDTTTTVATALKNAINADTACKQLDYRRSHLPTSSR